MPGPQSFRASRICYGSGFDSDELLKKRLPFLRLAPAPAPTCRKIWLRLRQEKTGHTACQSR